MRNRTLSLPNAIHVAFLGCALYWAYLIANSQMVIVWDAFTYESLGRLLSEKGWLEFFKTGPNREPLYPAVIAFSMGAGNVLGVSYQPVQAIIQFLILFLTQVLVLRLLRLLGIHTAVCALTIFYLGVSPSMVNSALSLFSEVIVYPMVLTAILLLYKSWLSLVESKIRAVLFAVPTGVLFVALTLCKGIFEVATPILFVLLFVSVLLTRNRKRIVNVVVYLVVFFGVFFSFVGGYKMINKNLNGHFAVTDRGDWALYGYTARRMEPLTWERFLPALAYVPGEGVCRWIFGDEQCRFWAFQTADGFGLQKRNELAAQNDKSSEDIQSALVLLSWQKVLQNPVQYVFLTTVEGLKMFFWESTQIGFVNYPAGLAKSFMWIPFKNGLRFVMAFFTFLAFVYLTVLLWRERANVLEKENPLLLIYLCLLFIISFVGCYSLVLIINRYVLPIVPLYLVLNAYAFQRACRWFQ